MSTKVGCPLLGSQKLKGQEENTGPNRTHKNNCLNKKKKDENKELLK